MADLLTHLVAQCDSSCSRTISSTDETAPRRSMNHESAVSEAHALLEACEMSSLWPTGVLDALVLVVADAMITGGPSLAGMSVNV